MPEHGVIAQPQPQPNSKWLWCGKLTQFRGSQGHGYCSAFDLDQNLPGLICYSETEIFTCPFTE